MAGGTDPGRGRSKSGTTPSGRASYQAMVEAANSIVLSIDRDGLVTYINRFGLEFFGFSADEILNRSPVETIAPKVFSPNAQARSMGAILKDPQTFSNHTNENIKKDGTRVFISWSNKGIYDDAGELVELVCVGNDITRLKQIEEELKDHRENLERLVSEKTRALSRATQDLVDSRNRIMVLDTISSCIIQGKTIDVTIGQVLENLVSIFKSCGAAYMEIRPGQSILTIEHARGDAPLPDLTGKILDVAEARPFFNDLISKFKPYAFRDTQKAEDKKGMDRFVADTGIRSGLASPIHSRERLVGVVFLYSVAPRSWSREETALMAQVSDSLSVGIAHIKNRNQIVAQEEFLENIFDGVDIAIFVLKVAPSGLVMVENVNETCRRLRNLSRHKMANTALDSLGSFIGREELDLVKFHVRRCIEQGRRVKFLEVIGENGYWLTRLTPIKDSQGRVFRIIGASADISEQKLAETALKKSEARLKEAQRIAKLGDCERDLQNREISCSDQLFNIFGWEQGTCPGYRDFLESLHEEDREYVTKTIGEAVNSGSSYDIEYRIISRDGREKIVNEIGEVVRDETGTPCKIAGIVQDVTEQKKFRDEIELASKVFDNAVEGVVVTDRNGVIQFVNRGFVRITGYSEEEAVGQTPGALKSDHHDRELYREMWESLDRDGHWAGEIRNRRKNGEVYPEWRSITAIMGQRGEPVRYMSVFSDLSDIREREEQLRFQANYDALTGLPNRTLLQDRIQMAVHRVNREHKGLALIFLDMDDFKHVNDTLGHGKGDYLLQQFAARLLESVREQDTVARYGGDEFIILIPDTNETKVIVQIIDRIKAATAERFIIDGKSFFLGMSIGVTICPEDGMAPDVLIANADMAMYRSKEKGKGRYSFFTPELNRKVARRVELEMALRMGLEKDEFSLYFQPKLDIMTGGICGAEALIRWNHPQKGVVSPLEFIPLAEETGLINPMGEWILEQAAARAGEWSSALGRPFPIAVNISPRQVRDADLAVQVSEILERHQIPPACLEIEITESAVMGNVAAAGKTFNALDRMGVKISLDDFGTGFSSLSYLRQFPISTLKIDKSFVDDIPGDPDSNTMVTTILTMAGHLGLITVAEGVETADQLEFLKANECSQVQGYYFAPPMPADDFWEFMNARG